MRPVILHPLVAVLGLVILLAMAWPLQYDGLLGLDGFAVTFLAISGMIAAGVGGILEGLAARAGHGVMAAAILVTFANAALWAPVQCPAAGSPKMTRRCPHPPSG